MFAVSEGAAGGLGWELSSPEVDAASVDGAGFGEEGLDDWEFDPCDVDVSDVVEAAPVDEGVGETAVDAGEDGCPEVGVGAELEVGASVVVAVVLAAGIEACSLVPQLTTAPKVTPRAEAELAQAKRDAVDATNDIWGRWGTATQYSFSPRQREHSFAGGVCC